MNHKCQVLAWVLLDSKDLAVAHPSGRVAVHVTAAPVSRTQHWREQLVPEGHETSGNEASIN